jgi:hypothetical protein
MTCLDTIADLASILTAVVAAGAALWYWLCNWTKRKRLEEYLRQESLNNPSKHTHTVLHLMAQLGLTESEVFSASFASRHIVRRVRKDDDTGLAAHILFEYADTREP